MTFVLSDKSRARLVGVHPKLVAVVERALANSSVDFMVAQGLRTVEEAYVNFGKGRTAAELATAGVPDPGKYAAPALAKVTWLRDPLGSKHLKQSDGFGHAVDLLPAPYDWKDVRLFAKVAFCMTAAAHDLATPIIWGGTWSSPDRPHFELA